MDFNVSHNSVCGSSGRSFDSGLRQARLNYVKSNGFPHRMRDCVGKNKKLIFTPRVSVVAFSRMHPLAYGAEGSIERWAELEELDGELANSETALGRLYSGVLSGDVTDGDALPEFAGRFCYRAWVKGRANEEYLDNIMTMEHGSILEHSTISFAITGVSRSLTHELIRHRHANISQESQRYVDAGSIKCVVPPAYIDMGEDGIVMIEELLSAFEASVESYVALQELSFNATPETIGKKRVNEAARSVLPNACETKLVWTGNLRALRHFLELRGGEVADLEIRRLAVAIFHAVVEVAPNTFQDMDIEKVEGSSVPVIKVLHHKV